MPGLRPGIARLLVLGVPPPCLAKQADAAEGAGAGWGAARLLPQRRHHPRERQPCVRKNARWMGAKSKHDLTSQLLQCTADEIHRAHSMMISRARMTSLKSDL